MFGTLARDHAVVERDRKIDVKMLVWTLVLGFATDGDARTIAGYRRAYEAATATSVAASSFYAWFTPALARLLGDLLTHALAEVAVPHTIAPAFERFRDVVVADTTIVRLQRFLAAFPATDHDKSGMKLYLVHTISKQSPLSAEITDERRHDSPLFETGSWLRGRLLLFDLGFFNHRRFALIDENGGFFVSRLKPCSNPRITAERCAWPGRARPLVGTRVQDVVGDLQRRVIDVTAEFSVERRVYAGAQSTDSRRFRVVGVRHADADDGYRLYVTNLPGEWFEPDEIATVYRARWEVELLFRELKSRYSLGAFQTEKAHIVRIHVLAAVLTLVVSRAILRLLVDEADTRGDQRTFPTERWATTFRSVAQLILADLAASYGYPPPDLGELLYREARQPAPSRQTLRTEVKHGLRECSTA